MVRLLALLDKLDLDHVQRTGERARQRARGAGARLPARSSRTCAARASCWAFDVLRADWRDALRDRAFRRGLVLLPAGERILRFYPRYDTEPSAIDEALAILRLALEDLVGGRVASDPTTALEIRVGTLAIPLDTLETLDLIHPSLRDLQAADSHRGTGALRRGGEISAGRAARGTTTAAAISTRNARNNRVEPGRDRHCPARPCLVTVRRLRPRQRARKPRRGRCRLRSAFRREQYVLSAGDGHARRLCENHVELENCLLDALRTRAIAAGFEFLSTLIEERLRDTGPPWFREAAVLHRVENYLRSGTRSPTCRSR